MTDDSGVGPVPPETDELDDFERRTFRDWDRSSLGDLRRAIERRRRDLAG